MSIQDLRPNPQDTTNFYLNNTYQATINPSASSSLPTSPPPFSPPTYAVWVNALWLLSLVISLTCALLANFMQKWAQRYLKVTQPDYSPHNRARVRAFFAEGVVKSHLPWVFETLPTLLHISLFLFFAGLVVFLANINITIFKLVLSWVSLCGAVYGYITIDPIFRHDSPYYTPLSFLVWHIVTGIPFFVYRFLIWLNQFPMTRFRFAYSRFQNLERSCRESLVRGMEKTAEETALESPSDIDTRTFMWTFDNANEDHELERFFSGLPGFRNSKVVVDPLPSLTEEEKWKLFEGLHGLLERTVSSDLLPAADKKQRAMICAKAIDPEQIPNAFILHAILFKYQHSGPVATAIEEIVRKCEDNVDEDRFFNAQIAISWIITNRQPFDDSWYILASNELGSSEKSLRDYATQGDSLSLVILIHVVRQQYTHFGKSSWDKEHFSLVLATASKFNIKNTSSKLQHVFCALWNEIVHEARGYDREMAFFILGQIRNVFLTLHQDTDSAPTRFSASTSDGDDILRDSSSYPVCSNPYQHSDSTPHFHEPSTSGPPPNSNASPSPRDGASVGRELGRPPSDNPSVRSSPFPGPLVEDILLTGLSLFSGCNSI